tara:strand:+ start:33 stop:437 length:405 start_codon:yes stop_codon:yes gene_type:complete
MNIVYMSKEYSLVKEYLLISLIFVAVDSVYLGLAKNYFDNQVKLIQGSSIKLNIPATIACYIFLTVGIYYFVVQKNLSYLESFALGIFVYGVFDTTTMAIFKNWKLTSVVMDTLWGGTLFVLVKFLFDKLRYMV